MIVPNINIVSFEIEAYGTRSDIAGLKKERNKVSSRINKAVDNNISKKRGTTLFKNAEGVTDDAKKNRIIDLARKNRKKGAQLEKDRTSILIGKKPSDGYIKSKKDSAFKKDVRLGKKLDSKIKENQQAYEKANKFRNKRIDKITDRIKNINKNKYDLLNDKLSKESEKIRSKIDPRKPLSEADKVRYKKIEKAQLKTVDMSEKYNKKNKDKIKNEKIKLQKQLGELNTENIAETGKFKVADKKATALQTRQNLIPKVNKVKFKKSKKPEVVEAEVIKEAPKTKPEPKKLEFKKTETKNTTSGGAKTTSSTNNNKAKTENKSNTNNNNTGKADAKGADSAKAKTASSATSGKTETKAKDVKMGEKAATAEKKAGSEFLKKLKTHVGKYKKGYALGGGALAFGGGMYIGNKLANGRPKYRDEYENYETPNEYSYNGYNEVSSSEVPYINLVQFVD